MAYLYPKPNQTFTLSPLGGDFDDLGDALTAVAAAGDGTALVALAGTYTEAGALTVPNNQITIYGIGDVVFASTLAAGFINVTGDDFVIQGVTLTTNQNGTLLYFDGAANGLVRNCRFERTGGIPFGVNTDNISTVRVEDCSFGPGTWNALLYHHGSNATTYLDAVDISCDPATRFVYALWGTVFGRLSLTGLTQTFTNRDDFCINSSADGCHLILDDVHVSHVDTGITQGLADSPITLRNTTILDAAEPLALSATAVVATYGTYFPLTGSTLITGYSLTGSLIQNNLGAAVAPAVTDDVNLGYWVDSRWLDTTAGKEYVCMDATDGAAVWVETTAQGETWLDTARVQEGHCVPYANATTLQGLALEDGGIQSTDTASAVGYSADGTYLEQTTAAAGGSDAESSSTSSPYTTQSNPQAVIKFEVDDWTGVRFYACFASANNMADSTTPAIHYVGIRYSAADDAEWKAVSDSGTGTPDVQTLSGNPAPANATCYYCVIDVTGDGTSAIVRIEDNTGTSLGTVTLTTKLPTTTTALKVYCGLEATGAAARNLWQFGWNTRQRGQT